MNHFEILGLTAQFELDVSSLSANYRELQRQCHPDKYATATKAEQRLALQKSAQINDAYQILKDPVRRGEYFLSLQGFLLNDEQQSLQDSGFLFQLMELRETLENIELSADEARLADFSDEVNLLYQALLNELTALLQAKAWSKAADVVRKMKFVTKLQNEVERIEERFF